jgi:uncharacterized membrane protein
MNPTSPGAEAFTDWRIAIGSHLPHGLLMLVAAAAGFALVFSAVSLYWEKKRGRALLLFALRAAAITACLLVAFQPTLELGQMTRIPNHVAVLVDTSRSMTVKLPDGKERFQRAADAIDAANPLFDRWRAEGHKVDLLAFGENLSATDAKALRGSPTGDGTRIGESLAELQGRYAGRDLGAVVVVSDGIDTGRIGRGPLDGETRKTLQALGAPVHTVLIGEPSLRDLSIAAVLADDFAFVRTPLKLEALLRATGLANRQVEVTLMRDGRLVDVRSVTIDSDDVETKVSFDWTPDRPGNFVFEIATPTLAGEALDTNNRQVFTLKVIRDRVRILHVCGRPSWDQRFLRSMLRLDPNVDLVSFFILRTEGDDQPSNPREMSLIPFPDREIFDEQLKSFDLLIFQNFNASPSYRVELYLTGLRDYVQSGGALAMIGGELSFASGGYAQTALREVLPVELEGIPAAGDRSITKDSFRPKLAPAGRSHPVTALSLDARTNEARWSALPPLEGINRVNRLKPGATPLLLHPTQKTETGEPAPVLAVTDAGKGRTLALTTDTAWHWGFLAAGAGDEGRTFQRFWEGAIRWLVRDPALTLLRIELDRVEYRRGQPANARVRTLHADYTPAANVAVSLRLGPVDARDSAQGAAPNEARPDVRTIEGVSNKEGEAHFELKGLPPGAFRLVAQATIDGIPLTEEQTFVVRPEGREFEDVISHREVLRELASTTGGDFSEGQLGTPAVKKPREVRAGRLKSIELWSNPLLLFAALGLLATEWALRRRAGHG